VIVRWIEKDGRGWNDQAHRAFASAHLPWLEVAGTQTFSAEVRQPLDQLIEGEHSRATWARARMGRDAARAFDADLRAALAPHAKDGAVAYRTRTVLTWGRPRSAARAA